MKKIFLILLIALSVASTYSQDKEPTQVKFRFPAISSDSVYLSQDSSYFKQDKFMLGVHWGGSEKISKALRINHKDGYSFHNMIDDPIYDSTYMTVRSVINDGIDSLQYYTHCDNHTQLIRAKAVQYEPTLVINSANMLNPNTNNYDNMNPIFGFKYIRGRIENDSIVHRSRLVLDNAALHEQVVLEDPWLGGCLFRHLFDPDDYKPDHYYNADYLGTRWYISINIRRNNINDNTYGNENVLKIELPYVLGSNNGTGLIKFDSIPSNNIYSNYILPSNRGIAHFLDSAITPKPNCFYITRNMLPQNCQNVTISAYFKLNDLTIDNPLLKTNMYTSETSLIDSLKIKVTYYNNCEVAIDWVRLESPNGQRYFRSYHDDKILNSIRTDLVKFSNSAYTEKGIKLFRFNSFIEGSYQDWAAERYFNKLIGNINASEDDDCILSKHFDYYVNPPNRWFGMYKYKRYTAAPYCKETNYLHGRNEDSYLTMHLRFGWEGLYTKDTLNSEYELWLNRKSKLADSTNGIPNYIYGNVSIAQVMQMDETQYLNLINKTNSSVQSRIESILYEYYVGPHSGFIFSDKFWWSQNFSLTQFKWLNVGGSQYSKGYADYRAQTGEEIRYCAWNSLIMGAKGMFYDGTDYYLLYDGIDDDGTFHRFQHYNYTKEYNNANFESMSDEEFLDSDHPYIGGDFINSTFEPDNLYGKLYNRNAIASTMGTIPSKLYIGRRTQRLELKKIHDQIRRCEDELMKLRLVAWMGKGFRLWNNHHPDYPDNIFSQYLAWDTTNNMIDTTRFTCWPIGRTKRVYQPDGELLYKAPLYEPWDSTFIDFTLLRNADTEIEDVFYVGVQNRRTSPLIFYQDTVLSGEQPAPYLRFLSTAEFDDSCNSSKNPTGYTRMRNYFWLKQGAREITLPFNYRNTNNAEEYALLRITELGADTAYDQSWSFCRQQTYLQKIDTVIGQDRQITFNMLPGEGKIFKVQVLHQDTTVTGILAHSNQSKLIMHPVLDEEGNETDIIRYHLVYFKPIVGISNTNGVYYRRSLPISKDSPEENIIWEPEILVSDSTIDEGGRIKNLVSCDYPSIVVRKDSDTLKAYIVFSCFKNRSRSFIAETKLNVNTSGLVQDRNGYELALYNGNNRAEWGNPVVNASSNGNYYAWSDTTAGIVAAWKTPDALRFQASNKINFRFSSESIAQHPSLNVYSSIDNNEDNCALVWQENPTVYGANISRILYTRLRHNDTINSLYKYLSPTYQGNMALLDTLNNISSLIDTSFNLRFPVINRYFFNFLGLTNISELVYWGAKIDNISPEANYLMNCSISNKDLNNVPQNWRLYWKKYIKSYNKLIEFPNISYTSPATDIFYEDDISLNFKYCGRSPDRTDYIGHFNYWDHSYISSGQSDSTDINLVWVKCIDKGTYPHLAKKKFITFGYEYHNLWQNRRVYQKTISGTNHIFTSAKYFYKGGSDEMLADWYIGFETADSSKKSFLFGAPELDEQRFSLKLPFEKVVSDEGYISFIETSSDTIASSWFSIEDAKELALKLKGSNNANSKVYIQNKETERTLRLNLPNGLKENKGAKAKYNLINGLGNEFRLLFVKNDDEMHYTEELWIEGLPIEEKPAGSFKGGDGIENIDLIQIVNRYYSDHNISIFPNPASEVLYLQANVPFEEANLTVTNLLGTKVIQQQINLSNSPELKLEISFLLPGMYYINISDGLKSISGKFLKK